MIYPFVHITCAVIFLIVIFFHSYYIVICITMPFFAMLYAMLYAICCLVTSLACYCDLFIDAILWTYVAHTVIKVLNVIFHDYVICFISFCFFKSHFHVTAVLASFTAVSCPVLLQHSFSVLLQYCCPVLLQQAWPSYSFVDGLS